MAKSAFIGFLIALGMLVPPVIHFVSGPLGPLVGGCFAGTKTRSAPGQSIGIGALMAAFMVAPMALVIAAGSLVESVLPPAIRDALGIAAFVIVVYTGLMGSAGAALGGYVASQGSTEKVTQSKSWSGPHSSSRA